MAIDFPTSPSVGQVYNSGSRSWVWNGEGWQSNGSTVPSTQDVIISIVMQQY